MSPSSIAAVARGMPSVTMAAIWTISWRISPSVWWNVVRIPVG